MAANNTLVLVIQAETGQANASIQGTNKVLAAFETQAIQAAMRAGKGFEGFEKSAIRAAVNVQNKFSVLGGVLGANVVSALASRAGELSLAGLKIAASFERSRIGLEAFLGSTEKANALFDEIQAFALKSPFEFKDLLIGANRLLAFDFAAREVPKTLQAVSSAVGALGGDIGKVNDLITALGQIQQAGKLTGEELRQLRNAGVEGIVVQGLGEAYGKTAAEIQKAVRDGIIPGKDAVLIATRALEQRFGQFNEKVSKTTEVTFSNVKDSFGKASEQAFKPFLSDINELVKGTGPQLEQFGLFIQRNAGFIRGMAEAAVYLGVALAAARIPAAITGISTALGGLAALAAANPLGLIAAGVVGLGYVFVKNKELITDYADSLERDFIQKLAKQGKSIEQIVVEIEGYNQRLAQMEQQNGDGFMTPRFEASAKRVKEILAGNPENKLKQQLEEAGKQAKLFSDQERAEFQRRMKEQQATADSEEKRKRLRDAELQAFKILEDAQKKEASNLLKIRFELAENLRQYGLTRQAIEDIGRASTVAFEAELKRVSNTNFEKQQEAERKRISDLERARLDSEAESLRSTLELRRDTADSAAEYEIRALDFVRDRRLAEIEAVDTRSVQSKIAAEQQKSEIEAEYVTARALLQIESVDRLAQREIAIEQTKLDSKLISEAAFQLKRDAILQGAGQKAVQIQAEQEAAIDIIRRKSASEAVKIQRDYFEDVFQDAKRSVGSLWDQFTRQGQTAAEKMRNVMRLAFEALAKELVSTALARQLAPLFAAFRGGSSGSQGNILGGLVGLGGGFGGLGSLSRPGAPGGTPGFAGPVSGLGGGAVSFGGLGNLGLFGAGKGLLTSLGMLGSKSVAGLPFGVSVIGANGKAIVLGAGGKGVYGATGGAMLAGGGILAFDGLRRGGIAGLAETAAGGALIGAKFGGPIGALIGGSIGAAAGFARLFIKGATEKAREKIKSVYGVDISANNILQQFVAIAKQSYGGNLDVAVRSQEVRDIVEVYAMSTGQNAYGMKPTMQPVNLSQRGGVLSILSNYSNGRPVNPVTGAGLSPAAPMVVQLQLDAPTTEMVLEGRAVSAMANNPRAVQGAVVNAQRANVGRQQSAVNMFAPGLILS